MLAIIGILAALLIPNLLRSRQVAKVRATEAYMLNLLKAGTGYLAEHTDQTAVDVIGGAYPTSVDCSNGWDVAGAGEYVIAPPRFPLAGCLIYAADFAASSDDTELAGLHLPPGGLVAGQLAGAGPHLEVGAEPAYIEYSILVGLIAVAAAGKSNFLLPGGPCIVSNLEGGGAFEGATHIITNVVTLPDWYFAGGDGEDAIHAAPSGMLERDLERGSGARYLPPAIGPL